MQTNGFPTYWQPAPQDLMADQGYATSPEFPTSQPSQEDRRYRTPPSSYRAKQARAERITRLEKSPVAGEQAHLLLSAEDSMQSGSPAKIRKSQPREYCLKTKSLTHVPPKRRREDLLEETPCNFGKSKQITNRRCQLDYMPEPQSTVKPKRAFDEDPVTPFTYRKRFKEDMSSSEEEREMQTVFQEDSRKQLFLTECK